MEVKLPQPVPQRHLPGRAVMMLLPERGTELVTAHCLGALPAAAASSTAACPFAGWLHWEHPQLPAPASGSHALAVTPFGSVLLLVGGDVLGVAVASRVDPSAPSDDPQAAACWWQVPLVPKGASFLAADVAARAGCVQRATGTSPWTCCCARKVCAAPLGVFTGWVVFICTAWCTLFMGTTPSPPCNRYRADFWFSISDCGAGWCLSEGDWGAGRTLAQGDWGGRRGSYALRRGGTSQRGILATGGTSHLFCLRRGVRRGTFHPIAPPSRT